MDRTHVDDGNVDVGTESDAVLVCVADGTVRAELASTLRRDYPVRTTDSTSDALASIDRSVAVVVVDDADRAFSLDEIVEARTERDCRFQIAALVSEETERRRERCDALVRKPVDDDEFRETIRRLHRRGRYAVTLRAYYSLSEEYAALVTDPDADEEELRSIEERLMGLRLELDDVGDALDDEDGFQVALGTDREPSA